MLRIETTRDELLKPLQTVSGIIERRHTMPILSNVLIENTNGQVKFLGTDLEIQIHTLGPKTEVEDFSVTTNAKKLQDILRALPDGQLITLEFNEDRLILKSGKGRYNLQLLPAKDFPKMNVSEGIRAAFTLTQKSLHEMLSQVQYAMAVQDIRYYLMGILMQVEKNQLRLVSTDGHRLAYSSSTVDIDLAEVENIILPRKTVLELFKTLNFPDEVVTIEILNDQIRFTCNDSIIISKVIEGKFPDYNRVIPLDNSNIFSINRIFLLNALERVSILANEKFRGVKFQIEPGQLTIICSNNEQEEAKESIEIAYQGETLDISFNINYVLDVLRNTHTDDVQFAFGDERHSTLVTLPNNHNFKYIVMPMRI